MWKLLLILALLIPVEARDFKGTGKVEVFSRKGNYWKGPPDRLVLIVINDYQYEYFFIEKKDSYIEGLIGKYVNVYGKVWSDSVILGDGLKHNFIIFKEYEVKR